MGGQDMDERNRVTSMPPLSLPILLYILQSEVFISRFPGINTFIAQIMLSRFTLRDLMKASLHNLASAFGGCIPDDLLVPITID